MLHGNVDQATAVAVVRPVQQAEEGFSVTFLCSGGPPYAIFGPGGVAGAGVAGAGVTHSPLDTPPSPPSP